MFFYLSNNSLKIRDERVNKISDLLEQPEAKYESQQPQDPANSIEFVNYYGYWEKSQETDIPNSEDEKINRGTTTFCLNDLNITIPKGTSVGIVGLTGAGKSTLLLSLLDEVPYTKGKVRRAGKIAYVEQEPTIYPGTIRENILFGMPYKADFYIEVVEQCCLADDFNQFPHSDLTEVGEKGINLSGGQRARIAFARAVYSQADVYLLDDPISAVDTKVGKKLVQNVIKGMLRDKTVLLVTHHLQYAKQLDKIIILDNGQVYAQGSHKELSEQGLKLETVFAAIKKNTKSNSPTGPSPRKNTIFGVGFSRMLSALENISTPKSNGISSFSDVTTPKHGFIPSLESSEKEDDDETDEKDDQGKLIQKENIIEGHPTFDTYKKYIMAGFSSCSLAIWIFANIAAEGSSVAFGRFLGLWANGKIDRDLACILSGVFAIVGFGLQLYRHVSWARHTLDGSKRLHDKMIENIVRSPVTFFDTNPTGRILNRFSTDLGTLDRNLPTAFFDTAESLFYFVGLFITVCVINPIVIIPGALGCVYYYWISKFCSKSMKVTKDLELVTRSPMYTFFSMSLAGLVPIRVFKQSKAFLDKFTEKVATNAKAIYYHWNTTKSLQFLIEYGSSVYIIAGLIILIITKNANTDSSLVGLAASYLLSMSETLSFLFRQVIMTDMMMASTARVISYTALKSEADVHKPLDLNLKSKNWPEKPDIKFKNVYMKYRDELDHVITNFSVDIKAGETVGIIGRSGAGKSTIFQMLFRMFEIDKSTPELQNSEIQIDGVDIQELGLHFLRNAISIIPQTPMIFMGTIRTNLDPFNKHSDEELWDVLKEVGLRKVVKNLEKQLDTPVSNDSNIFSVGEKQLVCLARAILRKSKILVLDEATANVDFVTDFFIQKKITENFEGCTILTIAHRLSTIANYDKVLVLSQGQLVEFGVPFELLVRDVNDTEITRKQGHFAQMVLNGGSQNAKIIFETCRNHYNLKSKGETPRLKQAKSKSEEDDEEQVYYMRKQYTRRTTLRDRIKKLPQLGNVIVEENESEIQSPMIELSKQRSRQPKLRTHFEGPKIKPRITVSQLQAFDESLKPRDNLTIDSGTFLIDGFNEEETDTTK